MSNFIINNLLTKLRKEQNYTIQKVANLLNVSKAAVSKWENTDDPSIDNLYSLSKIYNVSVEELLDGKLNDETNVDYWKRNYDLSTYKVEESIQNNNIDNLKKYFEHCNIIKNRFFELLPQWAANKLGEKKEEFFFLKKKYFKFDNNYFPYNTNDYRSVSEETFIRQFFDKIKELNKDDYSWEIRKLYDFTHIINSDIIYRSKNTKALEYMLSSFSQQEKDALLYEKIKLVEKMHLKETLNSQSKNMISSEKYINEIEQDQMLKVIINSGANYLRENKSFMNIWDEQMFNSIEGSKKEIDNSIYIENNNFVDFFGRPYVPIINNWKNYSYNDYLSFVDEEKTNKLKDIVNLRKSNPYQYYLNIIKEVYR